MHEPREQGWLQKIIEDADKRVSDWPEWKKALVHERSSSDNKAEASGDAPGDDLEHEAEADGAHA